VLSPLPYVKGPRGQARAPNLFVVLGPTALTDQGNRDGVKPQVAGRASLAASLHQGINGHRKGPVPGAIPGSRLGETLTPTPGPPPGPAPPTPAIPIIWGNRTNPTSTPRGGLSYTSWHSTPHRSDPVRRMVEFGLTGGSRLTR
jgi:hypothetical protein